MGSLSGTAGRPTLILVHHPPFATGIAHMDSCPMAGAEAFAEIVRRHPNVERVVCGHVHRPMTVRWGGTVVSTCPSTAHQFALDLVANSPASYVLEPPGFQLHHWQSPSALGPSALGHVGLVTHTAPVSVATPRPLGH